MEIEKLGTDVRSVLEPRRVANDGRNCAHEHRSETNYPLHVCPKSAGRSSGIGLSLATGEFLVRTRGDGYGDVVSFAEDCGAGVDGCYIS